jgi:hypothetical protein
MVAARAESRGGLHIGVIKWRLSGNEEKADIKKEFICPEISTLQDSSNSWLPEKVHNSPISLSYIG